MERKKKEAHWPSISSAHQCHFQSAVCPLVEESWKVFWQHKFYWEAPEIMKNTKIHKKMNKECRLNEHKIFLIGEKKMAKNIPIFVKVFDKG